MKVKVKVAPTGDGRWYAEPSGLRGFGVSPVLAETRRSAVDKAVAAVLIGLSYALEQGHVVRPRAVTFEIAAGSGPPLARRPAARAA
jgi:hypothetical protein